MKRIKFLFIVTAVVMLLLLSACVTKVEPGYVAVKVKMTGSNRGVDKTPVGPGFVWHGMWTKYYKYPTFNKIYPFTAGKDEGSEVDESFSFQSAEGVKCNADIGVEARIDSKLAPKLYQIYQNKDLETIIKSFVRADIRKSFNTFSSSMSVDTLYSSGKIKLIDNVSAEVQKKYEDSGIVIENITYLSDIRFPMAIQDGIVNKMAANQKALQRENERRTAQAEKDIQVIKAEADAIANTKKTQSITPAILEWERLQVQKQLIDAWKESGGKVPETLIVGSGEGKSLPNLLLNPGK